MPWQNDGPAAAAEDLVDNRVGDHRGVQHNMSEKRVVRPGSEERSTDPVWVHYGRPHRRRSVPVAQLLTQALMERHQARLRTAVVDAVGESEEATEAGDSDDVAVVAAHHRWQKHACHNQGGDGVDGENAADLFGRRIQQRGSTGDTGVVDEDGRVTNFTTNALSHCPKRVVVGEVNAVEDHVFWKVGKVWPVDIKNNDLDLVLRKLVRHDATNAAISSGDQDNLFGPVRPGRVSKQRVAKGVVVEQAVETDSGSQAEDGNRRRCYRA